MTRLVKEGYRISSEVESGIFFNKKGEERRNEVKKNVRSYYYGYGQGTIINVSVV